MTSPPRPLAPSPLAAASRRVATALKYVAAAITAPPSGFSTSAADPHGLIPVFEAAPFVLADGVAQVGKLDAPWGGRLEDGYAIRIAPRGKQTVRAHLLRAGQRYERAFAALPPAHGLNAPLYRLAIALHEAGRIGAELAGKGRGDRHAFMGRFLEANRAMLPVDGATFNRLKALLTTNPLGPYFRPDSKAASLKDTVARIEAGADAADLKPWEFLKAITPIYQSDLAAYTVDAGFPRPYFDSAFELSSSGNLVFDTSLGRLRMNPENEKRWAALEAALGAPKPKLTIVEEADRKAAAEAAKTSKAARARELARDAQLATLSGNQLQVVQRLHAEAPRSSAAAMAAFLGRAKALGYTEAQAQTVLQKISAHSTFTIYFFPETRARSGDLVSDSLIAAGEYQAKGKRKEPLMFEHFYELPRTRGAPTPPKYSALNAEGPYVPGASREWGSAFLDLKPEVNVRTSVAPSNSLSTDTLKTLGTTDHMARVLHSPRVSDDHFKRVFDYLLKREFRRPLSMGRVYMEGQVHGDVQLDRDLRAVVGVSKPSSGKVEKSLRRLANHFGVPLLWHEHGKLVRDS